MSDGVYLCPTCKEILGNLTALGKNIEYDWTASDFFIAIQEVLAKYGQEVEQ